MSAQKTTSEMDFGEWLDYGMEQGWISQPFCETHDGGPITNEEAEEFDEGGDPCLVHVRLYGV